MSDNKSFDKITYNNAYNKKNYTNCSLRIKPDIMEKINSFCTINGYSKTDFFVRSALYVIENDTQLPEYTEK